MNVFRASMDDLHRAVHAKDSTFTQSAVDYLEATSTNLDRFAAHGGKIIYYHGDSDPIFSMYDTIDYYGRLARRYGRGTSRFARLFLIPGMNHCSSGLHTLDSFDPLGAIVEWVEQDAPPDRLTAANSNSNPQASRLPLERTRPLCPYPEHAQFNGSGDPEKGELFTCVGPASDSK